MDLEKHWDNIFDTKCDEILGWFEQDFSQTLKFLGKIENLEEKDVFISGVGTSKIADVLAKREGRTILNDISLAALKKLEKRISNKNVEFFQYDISKPFRKKCDLWLDRAVLHFLVDEEKIDTYFESLKNSLNENGFVLFAQYNRGTALECASLPLHEYDLIEFKKRLGKEFILMDNEIFEFETPSLEKRLFIYALFKKVEKV